MNSLVFNPNASIIPEWTTLYLSEQAISKFQTIIDRTCDYLSVIAANRLKRLRSINSMNSQNSAIGVGNELPPVKRPRKLKRKISIRDEGGIERFIQEVKQLKQKFQLQYRQSLKQPEVIGNKVMSEQVGATVAESDLQTKRLTSLTNLCEGHLTEVKRKGIPFYDEFIEQEVELLEAFTGYKLKELNQRFAKTSVYLQQQAVIKQKTENIDNIRIVFDNLYIQTEYLRMFIHKNVSILQTHAENEHSAEEPQVLVVRERQLRRLKKLQVEIDKLKHRIRELYFQYYRKRKARKIKDHNKLQVVMRREIAVNAEEGVSAWSSFANGFIFAILLFALAAIIIFRQINITALEASSEYATQFQIWRGASYLISFNWMMAFVLYLLDNLGINYRMIMLEEDKVLERPPSFFYTACLLSTIFLVLFLIYMLQQMGYIESNGLTMNLGYVMWAINICFMLNPFKVLNYSSRWYFINILKRFIQCLFIPMNFNIFFIGMVLGSMAQPMNDFAFTACMVVRHDRTMCLQHSRIATFVYMMVYLVYRANQSFRLHAQYSPDVCVSRARQGLTAVTFTTNAVISSFIYGINGSPQLLNYWIGSACISTLTGTNADLRADWGVISLDEEDCLLRKYKLFPRKLYFFCAFVDLILNVGWALTISSDIASFVGIDVLYFFLLLANIQFCRRGMWITFRIEDDHMQNVGYLRAMADDSHLVKAIEQALNIFQGQKKVSQINKPSVISEIQKQNVNQSRFELARHQQSGERIEGEVHPVRESQVKEDEVKMGRVQQKLKQNQLKFGEMQQEIVGLKQLQGMVVKKQGYLLRVKGFLLQIEAYLELIHQIYQKLNWEDEY